MQNTCKNILSRGTVGPQSPLIAGTPGRPDVLYGKLRSLMDLSLFISVPLIFVLEMIFFIDTLSIIYRADIEQSWPPYTLLFPLSTLYQKLDTYTHEVPGCIFEFLL